MSNLKQNIDKWNKGQINNLIASYDKKRFRASGNWEQELESVVELSPTKINIKFLGAFYTYYMINGRKRTSPGAKAGNPTLREIILKWINDKGIRPKKGISKESLAFLITRKIHKKGIKPTREKANLITDAINIDEIKKLFNIIGDNYKVELIKYMKDAYN